MYASIQYLCIRVYLYNVYVRVDGYTVFIYYELFPKAPEVKSGSKGQFSFVITKVLVPPPPPQNDCLWVWRRLDSI